MDFGRPFGRKLGRDFSGVTRILGDVIPPVDNIVGFGAKTLSGHGGHDLGYEGAGTLSITSGNGSGLWAIDSHNKLVPAGTYPVTAHDPLGFTEGDAAYTLQITDGADFDKEFIINIIPNAYSITAIPSGTNADTTGSKGNQLSLILDNGSKVSYGDEIIMRDGTVYNDAQVDSRIRKKSDFVQRAGGPSAPTGEDDLGWVKVRPETPFGATIRRINFQSDVRGAQYLWFTEFMLEMFNPSVANGVAQAPIMSSGSGSLGLSWVKTTGNRISCPVNGGGLANSTNVMSGIILRVPTATAGVVTAAELDLSGHFYIRDNEFLGCYNALQIEGTDVVVVGNTFDGTWNDCIKSIVADWTIDFNLFINKKYGSGGLHGDYWQQNLNFLQAGTYLGGTSDGNIIVRGVGTTGQADGQGIFLSGGPGQTGLIFTDVKVRGNLYVATFARGMSIEHCEDVDARWNTLVASFEAGAPSVNPGAYSAGGNDGGNISYNAFATPSVTVDASPDTANVSALDVSTPNVGNINTLSSQQAAFVNPVFGADGNELAEILAGFAMKSGGTLDKAVTGELFHMGAIGTGYIDHVARTKNFPA